MPDLGETHERAQRGCWRSAADRGPNLGSSRGGGLLRLGVAAGGGDEGVGDSGGFFPATAVTLGAVEVSLDDAGDVGEARAGVVMGDDFVLEISRDAGPFEHGRGELAVSGVGRPGATFGFQVQIVQNADRAKGGPSPEESAPLTQPLSGLPIAAAAQSLDPQFGVGVHSHPLVFSATGSLY